MKKRSFTLVSLLLILVLSIFALASCSFGGGGGCTNHTDGNKDHKCDSCTAELTKCADADKNHKCDLCAKVLSACADKNADHLCDTCGKALSECADENSNGKCDQCDKALGDGGNGGNGGGQPDHTCADTDNDHKCDECKKALSECADADEDHACDKCGKALTSCEDESRDHKCDLCGKTLTSCKDLDLDGLCDICYASVAAHECTDEDGTLTCDICGDFVNCEDDGGSFEPSEYLQFLGISRTANGSFEYKIGYISDKKPITRFFAAFSRPVSEVTFHRTNQYDDYGTCVAGEGFIHDGKYLVPFTFTPTESLQFRYTTFTRQLHLKYLNKDGAEAEYITNISLYYMPDGDQLPTLLGLTLNGEEGNYLDSVTLSKDLLPKVIYFHFDAPVYASYLEVNGEGESYTWAYMEKTANTYRFALILKADTAVGDYTIGAHVCSGEYLWHTFKDIPLKITAGTGAVPPTACEHLDLPGDYSHGCVFCGDMPTAPCSDKNYDHFCDDCHRRKTSCMDADKDAKCDICKKPVNEDLGPDGSSSTEEKHATYLGVSLLDTGELRSTVFALNGLASYKLFMHFSVPISQVRITPSEQGGSFTAEAGYYKGGRFIVPVTYVPAAGQICETVRATYDATHATGNMGTHGTLLINLTENVVVPSFLGVSLDGNVQNATKALTFGFAELAATQPERTAIYLHFDGPICGANLYEISTYSEEIIHQDGIYTLKVLLNSNKVGTYSPHFAFFYGPSQELLLTRIGLFTVTVLAGTPCDECADNAQYPDGFCDTCGNALCSTHTDEDKNHLCDTCGKTASECLDENGDHKCDICTDALSTCKDENSDHKCDICKEKLTDCKDEDEDGACDICKEEMDVEQENYFDILGSLRFDDGNCEEWIVAIAPNLAPYAFVDLSYDPENWILGSEILLAHRLAKEMGYKLKLMPLSPAACISALSAGQAHAAIGCFSAEQDEKFGVAVSDSYATVGEETAVSATALVVCVREDLTNDLSMINKALEFMESEDAYESYVAAAAAHAASIGDENVDALGYYADGKKIYPGDECPHEDAQGDHICDLCGEKPFCTDTDYNGSCDICNEQIVGIENLQNPHLIGYSTEKFGSFFESYGTVPLTYGVPTTLYLKFNCEITDAFISFRGTPLSTPELLYTDTQGVVYALEIPAPEFIFTHYTEQILFHTPYSSSSRDIQFECIPTEMPELLGMAQDGVLIEGSPTVPEGNRIRMQFIMNVKVDIFSINYNGSSLVFTVAGAEQITPPEGDPYWLYTVDVEDNGTLTDTNLNFDLHYTYLGLNTQDPDNFLPVFPLSVTKLYYTVESITVNGTQVSGGDIIPFAPSYEITVTLNSPANAVRLFLSGSEYTAAPTEYGSLTAVATVSDIYGYQSLTIRIEGENGYFVDAPFYYDLTFAEQGEGGGSAVQILTIYDCVNECYLEGNCFNVWADGKLSLLITYAGPVIGSRIEWEGAFYEQEPTDDPYAYYYTVPMRKTMYEETGEFTLWLCEDASEENRVTFTYTKEAFAFYGIYTEAAQPVIENSPSGVTVKAGEDATVYLAMTAAVDPTELYIAGIDYPLTPEYNPWTEPIPMTDGEGNEITVYFYKVMIPAEVLSLESGMEDGVQKLAFAIDNGTEDYTDDVWATYSINFTLQ